MPTCLDLPEAHQLRCAIQTTDELAEAIGPGRAMTRLQEQFGDDAQGLSPLAAVPAWLSDLRAATTAWTMDLMSADEAIREIRRILAPLDGVAIALSAMEFDNKQDGIHA